MDIDKFFTTTADHYCNVVASGEEIYTFDKEQLFNFLEKFKQEICREQRELSAMNGLSCNYCNDEGFYVVPDLNGEAMQQQCEFCYTQLGSKFLILTAPEPKLERGEG